MASRLQQSKAALHYKRAQEKNVAGTSGNKFTAKQSKFAQRQEEKQIALATGGSTAEMSRMERGRRQREETRDFESNNKSASIFGAAAAVPASRSVNISLGRKVTHDDGAFAQVAAERGQVMGNSQNNRVGGSGKQNRFSLTENATKRSRDESAQSALGALLGHRHCTAGNEGEVDDDPMDAKKAKWERFQDVMERSKHEKAQNYKERLTKEQETSKIDSEFNGIMHLLTKRDKVAEDKIDFERTASKEVRELLEKYHPKGRIPKIISLSSNAPAKPIVGMQVVLADSNVEKSTVIKNGSQGLSIDSLKLLDKLRATSRDTKEPGDFKSLTAANQITSSKRDGSALVKCDFDEEKVGFGEDEDGNQKCEETIQKEQESKKAAILTDDFDKLMGMMKMDARTARAVERTLSPEEEAAEAAKMELLAMDRSAVPSVQIEGKDLTRKEWVQQGGDRAHVMDDRDEDEEEEEDLDGRESSEGSGDDDDDSRLVTTVFGPTPKQSALMNRSLHPIDRLYGRLEEVVKEYTRVKGDQMSPTTFRERVNDIICTLHSESKQNLGHSAQSVRLILIDLQKTATAPGFTPSKLSSSQLMLIFVILQIYPTSDHRHEITTSLFVFLCSTVIQAKLKTLDDARVVLLLSSLLTNALQKADKFASEPLVAVINVLALQMSRQDIEPKRMEGTIKLPCPLLSRNPAPILMITPKEKVATASEPLSLVNPRLDKASSIGGDLKLPVLTTALNILHSMVDAHMGPTGTSPAATYCICDPIQTLDDLLRRTENGKESLANYSAALNKSYAALLEKVEEVRRACISNRTPLAMRTFRPRPLRQFEPLLVVQENTEMYETKIMKKGIREDKKRLIRNIQAEANVDRREREKEAKVVDQRREGKYRQLIGELQQQQHIMKTVDSLMAKAKSKKKKNISGESALGGDNAE